MQISFNIVKKTKINDSFRTKKIKSDFDYKQNETENIFHGTIETPKKWNIGCIVGASGTGKSTIAKEKFGKYYVRDFVYDENSVLDNMNENCTVEESNGNTCFLIPSLPANGSSLYTPALDTVCVLVLPIYVNTGASCIVSGEYYGIYHNTNTNYKSHIVFRYTP